MSLTENLKFHLILVKNQHHICMYKYLGGSQNPQKQKKRRIVLITSLLFLFVCK